MPFGAAKGQNLEVMGTDTKRTIAGNLVLSVLEKFWVGFFFFCYNCTGKFLIFGGNIACKSK